MQPVERQPAPGIGDRLIPGMLAAIGLHQLLEHLAIQLAQALALKELPLVEGRAIRQREAGQKILRVQLNRRAQVVKTLGRKAILSG